MSMSLLREMGAINESIGIREIGTTPHYYSAGCQQDRKLSLIFTRKGKFLEGRGDPLEEPPPASVYDQ